MGESLGYSYLRLGLLNSIIMAIELVISRTSNQLVLPKAYNLLGDLLWLTGECHRAILCHEKTDDVIVNGQNEQPKLRRLHYSSLLNRGLCYLSLWEIDKAHEFFLELNALATNGAFEKNISYLEIYTFRANFCLSLTYSLINDKKNTLLCINGTKIEKLELIACGAWTRGYSMIFLAQAYKNINLIEQANTKYQEALQFAKESAFPQVEALALYGIGELERIDCNYILALSHIERSIIILHKICAKPDLAEAYFQFGLTYQAMGEHDQTETYKAKALDLFEEMKAPKQIERVKQAFQQGAKQ